MDVEDPPDLLHGHLVPRQIMSRRHNRLRFRAGEVRAPIRYDAVRTVWRIAPATIADDRMIWHKDGSRLERLKIGMPGRKRLYAACAQRIEIPQIRINRVFVQSQDLTREAGSVTGLPMRNKTSRTTRKFAKRLPRCGVARKTTR